MDALSGQDYTGLETNEAERKHSQESINQLEYSNPAENENLNQGYAHADDNSLCSTRSSSEEGIVATAESNDSEPSHTQAMETNSVDSERNSPIANQTSHMDAKFNSDIH